MVDFGEWSNSVLYLTICIIIPSMALYMAEIVTIVRHKKFHNSFYVLFVLRAIPDCLGVLNSFYGQRLPFIFGVLYPIYSKFPNWMLAMFFFIAGYTYQVNNLVTGFILLNRLTAIIMPLKHEKIWQKFHLFITIFVYFVPTLVYWPTFKMNAVLILKDPNSTTDRTFSLNEAGNAPIINYLIYIGATFTVIFLFLCILLNICTFIAYKLHMKKASINGDNNGDDIEKKLLIYALVTFLGHLLVTIMFLISIMNILKSSALSFIYYTLTMDTGTVVLASWLLLWASSTIRQQLIKDFSIFRKTNIQNIRVGAMEGPRNNNHWTVGGAVGHELQNRFSYSVQQLPTIS